MCLDKIKITNLFNETGFPFQHWCLETIKWTDRNHNGGWEAISEYPYTFPPSNGPILGVYGTIDIVAIRKINEFLLFLATECKRANENIKNWFFISDKKSSKPIFIYSKIDDKLNENKFISTQITFPNLGYNYISDLDDCVNAIETNDKQTLLNKNQEEKIYKALKQVNHGIYALENKVPKNIPGLTDNIDFSNIKYFIYIPLVVTTANLYIAEFNYKNVKSGNINNQNIEYKEKKWLSYEFPLPDFISYKSPKNISFGKRTTFVINDKSFETFLKNIQNIQPKLNTLKE